MSFFVSPEHLEKCSYEVFGASPSICIIMVNMRTYINKLFNHSIRLSIMKAGQLRILDVQTFYIIILY